MHGIGILVVLVLAVESIPLGILGSALLDSSLRRRERFGLRLTMFTVAQTAPAIVLIAGAALGVLSEGAVGELLAVCVLSIFVSPVLMPIVLFHGPEPGGPSEENDDEEDGPGPDRDRPSAPRPMGGLPLPDAEPSSVRARGPLPLAPFRWPRRPAREPDRRPSRVLSALRRRGLWGTPA